MTKTEYITKVVSLLNSVRNTNIVILSNYIEKDNCKVELRFFNDKLEKLDITYNFTPHWFLPGIENTIVKMAKIPDNLSDEDKVIAQLAAVILWQNDRFNR